ncbi:hypothetical protein [uncultured Bartonella sp.]|uniref:hypothetical protein n=1 Tax=uncultured Bartonella sp. TaxID=104108 RepID=UPI0026104494|nr:hypothetical protein [uncultured Bartonella sp.]
MTAYRLLVLLWAIFFAFLATSWLGSTHILSTVLHIANITFAAKAIFVIGTILFALLLHIIVPRTMPATLQTVAFLPPLVFFIIFFFYGL